MDYIEIKAELQAFFAKWLESRKGEIARSGPLSVAREGFFTTELLDAEQAISSAVDDFTVDDSIDEHLERVVRVRDLSIEQGSIE